MRQRYTSQATKYDAYRLFLSLPMLENIQDGTAGVDNATDLALVEDGSAVLSGSTTGDWNVTNLGGTDFAALKLDADGELLWKWQVTTMYSVRIRVLFRVWSVSSVRVLCVVWRTCGLEISFFGWPCTNREEKKNGTNHSCRQCLLLTSVISKY